MWDEALVGNWWIVAVRVGVKRGLRPDEAEDCAQEAVMRAKAAKLPAGVTTPDQVRMWFYGILRNVIYEKSREGRRESDPIPENVQDPRSSPEQIMIQREQQAIERKLIVELDKKLTPRQRDILRMRLDGCSQKEIATCLESGEATISRELRSLKRIYTTLRDERGGRHDT